MRYSNNDLLSTIQSILTQSILPELQSANAQTAAHFVMMGVDELRKRDLRTPALLVTLIDSGLTIAAEMSAFLATRNSANTRKISEELAALSATDYQPDNLAGLERSYNALMDLLEMAGRDLVSLRAQAGADQQVISSLLHKAAWWEYAYMEQQGQPLDAAMTPGDTDGVTLQAEALQAFIRSRLPEANTARVSNLQRIPGGMGKETYFFELDTGIPGHEMNRKLAVRRTPHIVALDQGAFNLSQEYDMVRSAYRAGIQVPQPFWLGEDVADIGGKFFVSAQSPGAVCGTFIATADDVPESFWLDAAEQLAKIHTIPIQAFSDYITRWENPRLLECTADEGISIYLNWWKDYWKTFERMTSPAEIYLMDWLLREIPPNDRPVSLIHGDYGSHNLLQQDGRLSAILDWEGYLFGDPAFDLAYVKKYVSTSMDWSRFLEHYYQCGGPETDESTFGYFEALQYTRVLTASNMTAARIKFQGSTDLKNLMLVLGFLPEMTRLALVSADHPGS